MFIIVTEPNLFIFILALSHVLSLRIGEKLRSHYAEVIGNVHAIFNRTNKLENLFSLHLPNCFCQCIWPILGSYCQPLAWPKWRFLIHYISTHKSSSNSSKVGEMQTFSLNFSENKTDGAKISNLAALKLDLLKHVSFQK